VQTVPYLVHQYETFEWAKVADKFDPVAIKDAAIDEFKASLPFGLGKSVRCVPRAVCVVRSRRVSCVSCVLRSMLMVACVVCVM